MHKKISIDHKHQSLLTLDRGAGLSPDIDNTIQFSQFPDVELLISGGPDEH